MSNKLKGANIFKAGVWNKQTFTEADLDAMVEAFTAANKAGRVPLKFGHSDYEADQPFREGLPAMGWVERIWRVGKDLYADFIDIPTAVFKSIQRGLYKFVSIELLKNAEYEGKRFPYLLDAVALLGADPPAVSGLDDLQKLALSRASFTFSEVLSFTAARPKSTTFTLEDSDDMDPKELQAAIDKALKPLNEKMDAVSEESAKFKRENETLKADLKKATDKAEADAKTAKAEKVKLAREKVTNLLEAAVRAKKILPAAREKFAKLFKVDNDDAVLEIAIADVEELAGLKVDEATKVMADGKSAFSRKPGGDASATSEEANVDDHKFVSEAVAKAVKLSRERNVDVFTAFEQIVREEPEMGQRFLAYTFEPEEAA